MAGEQAPAAVVRRSGLVGPGAAVQHYPEGASARNLQTGYVVLTHGEYWASRMIRFGQRLRFS